MYKIIINYKRKDDKFFACLYCTESDENDDKNILLCSYHDCGYHVFPLYSDKVRTKNFKSLDKLKNLIKNDLIIESVNLINKRREKQINKDKFINKLVQEKKV